MVFAYFGWKFRVFFVFLLATYEMAVIPHLSDAPHYIDPFDTFVAAGVSGRAVQQSKWQNRAFWLGNPVKARLLPKGKHVYEIQANTRTSICMVDKFHANFLVKMDCQRHKSLNAFPAEIVRRLSRFARFTRGNAMLTLKLYESYHIIRARLRISTVFAAAVAKAQEESHFARAPSREKKSRVSLVDISIPYLRNSAFESFNRSRVSLFSLHNAR